MATSGSQRIKPMWDRNFYMQFSWEVATVYVADNTTAITWKLEWISEDVLPMIGGTANWSATINGETYSGTFNDSLGTRETKTIKTGSQHIVHNPDGTKTFAYSFSCNPSTILYGTKTGSGTGELDAIPRKATITSATNFNDEGNPVITYSNPAGNNATSLQACISLTGAADNVPYRDIPKDGTSYTFELSDEERATLRRATYNDSLSVRFYVKSVYGETEGYSYITRTMTLVNYEPTLSPTVRATDARTLELTGDTNGGKLIRYYSDVQFDTGAVARKEATIDYQTIRNGSTYLDDYTSNTGSITGVDSNTFYFSAVDSRGNITRDFVNFTESAGTWIPYVKLTSNLSTGFMDANGNLTFTVSGKYFDGSFGAKSNSLEVEYSVIDENGNPVFNKNGSGWVVLGTVSPTVDGSNNYKYSHTITGLSYSGHYLLSVNVIDELTPVQTMTTVVRAVPVFDWGSDDFNFNVPVFAKQVTLYDDNNGLFSQYSDDTVKDIMHVDSSDNLYVGLGGYSDSVGSTRVFGDDVSVMSKGNINIDSSDGLVNISGNTYVNITAPDGLFINDHKLARFVMEEGTNGTWFYRWWNTGRIELYGYQNISNLACNTALGGWYRTAVVTPPSFPFEVQNPKVVSSYESNGYGAMIWNTTLSTFSKPPDYYLIRPTSSAGISGVVNFYVQGVRALG